MIMVFNILNVFEDDYGPSLIMKTEIRTRGHDRSLVKGRFKTNWKKMGLQIGLLMYGMGCLMMWYSLGV